MHWLIVFLLACLVFNGLPRRLNKFDLGKLPADFGFRLGGRQWYIPPTSLLVLSLLAMAIGALI